MQVEDFCFLIIHGYRYLIILEKPHPGLHVEEFIYLSVAKKKGASQTYDTASLFFQAPDFVIALPKIPDFVMVPQ